MPHRRKCDATPTECRPANRLRRDPQTDLAPCVDSAIVRAAIHPAIGIARIGDSGTEYYIGPQVTEPTPASPGFYRDIAGALKREAALLHIYGYNAAGEMVRELTADNADIVWTAHLANRKADWYQFQLALDISDAAGQSMQRRNPDVPLAERHRLAIDPGPRNISGKSISGPSLRKRMTRAICPMSRRPSRQGLRTT
jgi:hypothetical protein